jgi:threonylcarbamoyladenosine tRNA methylthiotransferase MtaB
MKTEQFEDIPMYSAPGRTRAFLKIQDGCNNFCSYCIIPYARGGLRSRPLSSIKREVENLIAAGFQEIVLTGIHLGAYGREIGLSIADAVKEVLKNKELVRLRLGSLETIEISTELIRLMQEDKRLCSHLHLPLQAGSEKILKAMNRHYTAVEYKSLVAKIRTHLSDIAISTDIIVGFPGETEELFAEALSFVETMDFSRMHIFPYSRRSGTPAAKLPDQIGEEIKRERVQKMQLLADEKSRQYNRRLIGRKLAVLLESEKIDLLEGFAENYVKVYCNSNSSLAGTVQQVAVEKQFRDGVYGQIIKN